MFVMCPKVLEKNEFREMSESIDQNNPLVNLVAKNNGILFFVLITQCT